MSSMMIIFLLIGNVHAQSPDENLAGLKSQLQPLIDSLSETVSENALQKCQETLTPIFDAETLIFLQFLDTHYRNKSANSSLNNIAIAKYSEYKKAINIHLENLKAKSVDDGEALRLSDEFNALLECNGLAAAYTDLSKVKMLEHIRTTTYEKKTTMMLEKYKSVNDDLRDLHFKIAKMYAYFATFRNKLPGFLSSCVTK